MQVRTGRQMVTGLTVNSKVNVPQDYARAARARCDTLFRIGTYHRGVPITNSSEETPTYEMIDDLNILEGSLSYIYNIKHSMELIKNGIYHLRNTQHTVKIMVPGQKIYMQFLFYKYFVSFPQPLIICEGRTDNIYLKYGIRHLSDLYPHLGHDADNGFKPTITLFSYKNNVHRILELTGGSGTLQKFMGNYTKNMKRYQHRPLYQPVIMLIDNDSAVTDLKGNLKKLFDVDVSLISTEPFYHLTDNLYLIKTPEKGASGTSCIEDCFDDGLKATLLEGKSFNPEKNLDPEAHYGKGPFAEKVVVPNANEIDWEGFRPLLDRISAVIGHYVPPASATLAKAA